MCLCAFAAAGFMLVLAGCGGKGGNGNDNGGAATAADWFPNAVFESKTVVYDGETHSITVGGVSADTAVTYANNSAAEAGVYRAFVHLQKGEREKVMSALLTIEKAAITGVSMPDKTVVYDGEVQTLAVVGAPDNADVNYFCDGLPFTGAADAGEYTVTARLTGDAYQAAELTAVLTISRADISGVTAPDTAVTYDGKAQRPAISGRPPRGSTVTWVHNGQPFAGAVMPGAYNLTVKIENKNYNTLEIPSVFTIERADINGITFPNYSAIYDGGIKTMAIAGDVPDGVNVTYIYEAGGTGPFDGASEVGQYKIRATLTGDCYETLSLVAALTIAPAAAQQLPAVTGLAITTGTNAVTDIMLNWTAVANAANYEITAYSGTDFTNFVARVEIPPSARPYNVRAWLKGIVPMGTYNLAVVALPAVGSTSYVQSEPAYIEYTHTGVLFTPENLRIEGEFLVWDTVADVTPPMYALEIELYDDEGYRIPIANDVPIIRVVDADRVKLDYLETEHFFGKTYSGVRVRVQARAMKGHTPERGRDSGYTEFTEIIYF